MGPRSFGQMRESNKQSPVSIQPPSFPLHIGATLPCFFPRLPPLLVFLSDVSIGPSGFCGLDNSWLAPLASSGFPLLSRAADSLSASGSVFFGLKDASFLSTTS